MENISRASIITDKNEHPTGEIVLIEIRIVGEHDYDPPLGSGAVDPFFPQLSFAPQNKRLVFRATIRIAALQSVFAKTASRYRFYSTQFPQDDQQSATRCTCGRKCQIRVNHADSHASARRASSGNRIFLLYLVSFHGLIGRLVSVQISIWKRGVY